MAEWHTTMRAQCTPICHANHYSCASSTYATTHTYVHVGMYALMQLSLYVNVAGIYLRMLK